MISIIFDVIFNIFAYWILILIVQYICSAHILLSKTKCFLCTIFSAATIFFLPEYAIVCIPVLVMLTIFMFSSRKGHDLLLFFPAFAIYFVLTIIPECILDELFPNYNKYIYINGQAINLVSLLIDLFLLGILLLLRHVLLRYKMTVRLSKKDILGCIGLFFFSLLDGALLAATNHTDMEPIFALIWKVIFLGTLVFTIGYCFYSIIESQIEIHRQMVYRSETEYLRVQLDSLQDIKNNEEQIKSLRHDLNNHLIIIQSLCEDGNLNELKKYTEHLQTEAALGKSNVITGNPVADLIIHSKMKTAQEQGIAFTFHGSLKHLSDMDAPDICGLLGNAYDNAIEACLAQTNAYIHTKVSSTRNYTVIQICNSVNQKIPIRNNQIATTKKEKSSHGYGINIMKRIAHKYGGNCTLSCSEKEFTVKIVLLNSIV